MNYCLDCGTHFFQGLNKLNDIYHFDENWTIYSFEANPETFLKSIKYKPNLYNLFHFNKAVSIADGWTTMHCDKDCGQGSNILPNPPHRDIVYGNAFNYTSSSVETIDLCYLIQNLDSDRLIIKLDIEGEEFNILPRIIQNKNIYTKINSLYIEFHERFFLEQVETYIDKKNTYTKFFNDNNINIIVWD